HTRFSRDWSSDVCSSDLIELPGLLQVYIQPKGVSSGTAARSPQAILPGARMRGKLAETETLQEALGVVAEIAPFSEGFQPQGIRSEERRVGKEGGTGWRP